MLCAKGPENVLNHTDNVVEPPRQMVGDVAVTAVAAARLTVTEAVVVLEHPPISVTVRPSVFPVVSVVLPKPGVVTDVRTPFTDH